MDQEELELIQGCRKNHRTAQRSVYEKYKVAMYTISFRITGDRDESHDALQEAFIEVFRDIKDFKMQSTLGAWIKTIVVRKSLRRIKGRFDFEPVDELNAQNTPSVENDFTGQELHTAIMSLPDGYRTIFMLVEVEGYKHREVSQMIGISEGTSKSQLYHAKKMLQSRLKMLIK
ncbi:MAG: RNA polymerase sigma factor [Bacteroidota bacterium]